MGSDPFSALTKYITFNIYLFPICTFLLWFFRPVYHVQYNGSASCSPAYDIPIFDMIFNFIACFFWGWVNWYNVVKMKSEDTRCPCCCGRVCYLIMGALSVLGGINGLWAVSHMERYQGCDFFTLVMGLIGLAQVIPGLLMGATYLIIYSG